ncbi:AI-2E family transporter [candidate division WWE3 bacterium]|uniref:AI-2E family transporter n=1 Tax=candidate division WWE3 bacterium TaxID=2053526 RepID=A0A955LJI7_UNCKA|nr:AI-2E family transporter [candidate division WWE3 bacterium]
MNRLEINTSLIVRVALYVALIVLGVMVYDIVLLLVVSYILMTALTPVVSRLEKLQVPRWLALISLYLAMLILVSFLIGVSLPPLFNQMRAFIERLPVIVWEFVTSVDFKGVFNNRDVLVYVQNVLQGLSTQLSAAPVSIVRFGAGVLSNIVNLVVILVFTFYLTLEREKVRSVLVNIIPVNNKKRLVKLIDQVDEKLGAWLRGQLLLMLVIGLMTWTLLTVLRIEYAVPLALLAGAFEVIPIVGPILALIPAVIVVFTISPLKALIVFVAYLAIQQIENNILVPRIMKRAVGIDPLLVVLSLMVGSRVAGTLGALLAIPFTAVLLIVYQEIKAIKRT